MLVTGVTSGRVAIVMRRAGILRRPVSSLSAQPSSATQSERFPRLQIFSRLRDDHQTTCDA
jgi:hypothetical protein